MVEGTFMSWTPVEGGFARTLTLPNAPANLQQCFGEITVTSNVNGDAVTYDTTGPNLTLTGANSVNVLLPTAVVNRILAEGQALIQLDVVEPSGARNTLLGGLYRVNAAGDDLEPVVTPHPRAALKQAIADATTIAALKTATLNYFNAVDP